MRSRIVFGLGALVALVSLEAGAASITDIEITNLSSPDFVSHTTIRDREFRTEATAPTEATENGDEESFTTRMAWMAGHHVHDFDPDGNAFLNGTVAYELTFTVEDPGALGYLLRFDSLVRGYLTARFDDNIGPFPSLVTATGTFLSATLDSGNGSQAVSLGAPAGLADATDLDPFENELVSGVGSHDAGAFFGTRSFVLRFDVVGTNVGANLELFNTGEAGVRFGLNPTLAGFTDALTPGVDGEPLEDHGHFVTVTVEDLNVVPEPGTVALLGWGLVGLGRFGRPRMR